ncbi:MAG: YtxH domain-containing protein [Bacteroidaceae bacterium]|nr:YtxH domain-containing protein [Prevotellaceae bacterium]MDD7657973.1 YtxH domain-containing protein [Prevotellaceae bacterium]MDY5598371.1 YtxH domain-containing protein [Bacteroidaceae bacterium]MDY5673804.1 YtxH domain-containing protein [Bacteroidaceae bacterium]
MKAMNFVIGFISGAAIGATCGLLFAPEKGSDLREKIAEALRKRGIRLNRQEMANLVDEIAEEIKSSQDTDE